MMINNDIHDGVAVRLRQEGRDRGGAIMSDFLGIFERDEAVRVAQDAASQFDGQARINDFGGYINVWVPLPADERERVQRLREAYERQHARSDAARGELRAAALELLAQGASEVEVARLAGVTRMTIRSWRGKPTGKGVEPRRR